MCSQKNIKQFLVLTPIFGVLIYLLLYFIATLYYPGGSQFDKNEVGFSWAHNYWCNLLNEIAINGQVNTARPIALAAMCVLCLALNVFWLQFPDYTDLGRGYKLAIRFSGMLAMLVGLFLFSNFDHDLVTNLASGFGMVATVGTFMGLYKNGWRMLFYFGIMNLGLVIVNNVIYYNEELISFLPTVQKITFASFLLWIGCISVSMYQSGR